MKAHFPIIKRAGVWVSGALLLMIASAVMFYINFRPSIQFTGGAQIKVEWILTPSVTKDILAIPGVTQAGLAVETINGQNYSTILTQVTSEDDVELTKISKAVQETLLTKKYISDTSKIVESSIVWPSIGEYLTRSARNTILIGLLLIAIYMVFSFAEVRRYIQPQVLAAITIFTMLFDVLIPMGVYGIKMMLDSTVQVDVIFVIALLTTMGYSINDTIVIFDRIRENLTHMWSKSKDIGQLFEDSIWQTMRRSMGTSLATFVVVVAMYVFGTGDLGRFAFSMGVGVISGTFSSIFLAAPLSYLIIKYTKKHK
jgi:preprotein translocase SecF subunit